MKRLSRIYRILNRTYLVDDINTKVDRTSMAHSLETREPLTDHHLVELAARLPSDLKVRNGQGKYVLKEALRGRVPDSILYRPKMGFAVPLASWFRGPLRTRVQQLASSEALLDTGMIAADAVRRLVALHIGGTGDFSAALWALLIFDAFVRRLDAATWRDAAAVANRAPDRVIG